LSKKSIRSRFGCVKGSSPQIQKDEALWRIEMNIEYLQARAVASLDNAK
jgi:hypothetical protein